jgi:excisionase family DNA binding protein
MRSYYTTFEAARVLGVSLPTVVNWIKARRLKAHRTPGGHRRIARGELAAFMLRHGMPLPDELSGAAPERRKVLVVGLAGPAREGTVRQLAEAGYAVEQTSPGFAAGAAAARFGPDAVVLQVDGEDGGEPLRDLLSDRDLAGTPVVGVGRNDWLEGMRSAGCTAAVAGPLGSGAISEAVEQALSAAPPKGSLNSRARAGARPRKRRVRRARAD